MSRGARLWTLFAICLALALGAMGWVTLSTLRTARADIEKQKHIELGARTRIALWRMESMASSLVSLESSRPWFHYNAFNEARISRAKGSRESQTPSPLLMSEEPHLFLHFQVDAGGHWSSPQIPSPAMQAQALERGVDPDRLAQAKTRLRTLEGMLTPDGIREALIHREVALNPRQLQEAASIRAFSQGSCAAFWCGKDLFLARQVWVDDQEYLQGCWVDWTSTRQALLSTVLDLLPEADLVATPPTETTSELRRSNTLGALSVRLIPGQLPPVRFDKTPSVRIALSIGWICILLSFLAGALVLHRTIQLGERRMAFASAVTHELRTPLTTFRLYTGLLASGMVTDEAERQVFLKTLATEADRLDHLVKNVLSFARLETRPAPGSLQPQRLESMLTAMRERLNQRTLEAGMELVFEIDEAARERESATDPSLVEQILLNLVDNACKYAASSEDRRIHIEARVEGAWACIACRDHGPGLDMDARKSIFKPFGRSSRRVALGVPGVGLGLALCRRLARGLGGELKLATGITEGACFELRLPIQKS